MPLSRKEELGVLFPVGAAGSDKQLGLEWGKESLEGVGFLT